MGLEARRVARCECGWCGGGSPVLSAVDTIVQLNADQVTAARGADVEGFVQTKDGLQAIQPELERVTASAGVPTCADVHRIDAEFLDPARGA